MKPEIKVFLKKEILRRWEEGVPHDTRSIAIYKSIEELDFEIGGDSFCFKSGGDGDNGEHLMYLLDIHFYLQNKNGGGKS